MSVTVKLYSNSAPKEMIDKTGNLTEIETLSCVFKEPCSVLTPVLQIRPTQTSTDAKLLKECNYVYIQEFGRYYYVTEPATLINNLIELQLSVDPLFSWKTALLNQDVIVSRNEKEFSLYLDDAALKVYNNPNICIYHFKDSQGNNTGFTAQEFILALAGSN